MDMVSQVHGIEKKQLNGVIFTLRHAQAAMRRLVTKDTILVGHALNNDLQVRTLRENLQAVFYATLSTYYLLDFQFHPPLPWLPHTHHNNPHLWMLHTPGMMVSRPCLNTVTKVRP